MYNSDVFAVVTFQNGLTDCIFSSPVYNKRRRDAYIILLLLLLLLYRCYAVVFTAIDVFH